MRSREAARQRNGPDLLARRADERCLRNAAERRAIIAALADAPVRAIWLKVENFGDDATGEKVAAYIEACRDFHERGLPLVGDHVGGLPGLGALAFGAVGGIAHGVTMQQNFRASGWRRPRVQGSGRTELACLHSRSLICCSRRKTAQTLFAASPKIRAMCGCRDTHCCPHGTRDMLGHPARHAIYQRAREIERLSAVPQSVRAAQLSEPERAAGIGRRGASRSAFRSTMRFDEEPARTSSGK